DGDPDAGAPLLEASYFGNTGRLGVPVSAPKGRMFLAYETASEISGKVTQPGAAPPGWFWADGGMELDVRPTELVTYRDGVWSKESYAYDRSSRPADRGHA